MTTPAHPGIDPILAALADPVRRRVVELLRTGPCRAGELAERTAMQPSALSRHLRALRRTGLIEERPHEQDARVRIFQLCPQPFSELRGWIDEVESYWHRQLAGFKAHAERRGTKAR